MAVPWDTDTPNVQVTIPEWVAAQVGYNPQQPLASMKSVGNVLTAFLLSGLVLNDASTLRMPCIENRCPETGEATVNLYLDENEVELIRQWSETNCVQPASTMRTLILCGMGVPGWERGVRTCPWDDKAGAYWRLSGDRIALCESLCLSVSRVWVPRVCGFWDYISGLPHEGRIGALAGHLLCNEQVHYHPGFHKLDMPFERFPGLEASWQGLTQLSKFLLHRVYEYSRYRQSYDCGPKLAKPSVNPNNTLLG